MATKLEQLLKALEPDRTLNEVARRADEAMSSFSSPVAQITDWETFRQYLVRFHQHLEAKILRLRGSVSGGFEFDWGRCSRALREAFGASGEKAAFEIARTGTEGGLRGVLQKLAQTVASEYAQNEVKARIAHYWCSLSMDDKLAAPDEYLQRYGHLLPPELTEGSAARIRAAFPKVLEQHARLIQGLRQIGRS